MLFSEHEKIQEKNSQHLGAFKLWINVIHRMLYSLFRISVSHSPLWHFFLRASHLSGWEAFIARIFYPYLFEQKKHTLPLLPREKENHGSEKKLQNLTT